MREFVIISKITGQWTKIIPFVDKLISGIDRKSISVRFVSE